MTAEILELRNPLSATGSLPVSAFVTKKRTEVRLATRRADLEAAYRLRYRAYVAEQGKPYPESDHVNGFLSDEIDEASYTLLAFANGVPCATVRASGMGVKAVRSRYADVFEIARIKPIPTRSMFVCSRLAVSAEFRGGYAGHLTIKAVYEHGINWGARLTFASVSRHLKSLYEFYGFQEYLPPTQDHYAGELCRLVLVNRDVVRLSAIRSPFAPIALQYGIEQEKVQVVDEMIEAHQQGRQAGSGCV